MTRKELETLGTRIRDIRQKRGFTQEKLAEELDCSSNFISYIERGKKGMSIDMLVNLANVLNVSADELFRDFLVNTIAVSNHQFAAITADCTTYEMRVLLDLLTATKRTLRENRRLIKN